MNTMNTAAQGTASKSAATFGAIAVMAVIGLVLMVVAGHAQSSTLHDAAHDMRHATGFPCH